jgi:pyruvate/2-oxoglutarate dehydrogenase complex dihydrolipoamide acyltransferase (E2) component
VALKYLVIGKESLARCNWLCVWAVQVSVNDFIVRATALALTDIPRANSQWDAKSGEVVPCQSVDISIAVATDKGLITPIVKDANKKSLTQISAEASAPSHSCWRISPVN